MRLWNQRVQEGLHSNEGLRCNIKSCGTRVGACCTTTIFILCYLMFSTSERNFSKMSIVVRTFECSMNAEQDSLNARFQKKHNFAYNITMVVEALR
ncbi:hypothetical protein TNIN_174501 [Trichonephila inaurata madagascariensis]|uniref:Uncharacterized protein n=1 Tax=Trichonephila inaurata madagascariensis TaxID=2747483 RepID=A0A8X6YKP1_9ARAC|nr:hypothetical protein TNIN_174501 [Trichonephila inaurata madagascariensis]